MSVICFEILQGKNEGKGTGKRRLQDVDNVFFNLFFVICFFLIEV